MSYSIRTAIESDAPAVSKLIAGLGGYFAAGSVTQISQEFWDSVSAAALADVIVSSEHCCYLAEDLNGLCGFVTLRYPAHLLYLFIETRAQSKGLGKLLWQKVLEQTDCSEITVNSSLWAVPFYRRVGFTRVGPEKNKKGLAFAPMVFKCAN